MGIATPLKLLLADHEEEFLEFLRNLLSKVGLTVRRPFRSLMLGVFIFSILDSQRWAWRIRSLEKVVSEFWLFTSHVGNLDRDFDLYTSMDYLETAIEDTERLVLLNDKYRTLFTDAIRYLARFLIRFERKPSLAELAEKLACYVLDEVSISVDWEVYKTKAPFYGRLHVLRASRKDPLSLIRISLMALPLVNSRIADYYLFLLCKAYRLWGDEPLSSLRCPVDPPLVRVLRRIGILRGGRPRATGEGYAYRLVQSLAKGLFPEDPSKLYTLRYAGELFCGPQKPLCEECWLFGICSEYLGTR